MLNLFWVISAALVGGVGGAGPLWASGMPSVSGYNQPPKTILDVMRAKPLPFAMVNPTHDKVLLVAMEDYPSIQRVATPFLRLAGVRIEPGNHSKHDTPGGYGIAACAQSFTLVDVASGVEKPLAMKYKCASAPVWSADGRLFAIRDRTATAVELWIGTAKTGAVKRMANVKLNPMFGDDLNWMPDQKSLLVKLVPKNLGLMPKDKSAPQGADIQETQGEKGSSSTYEKRDTLTNKYDETLFDYFGASQMARVEVATGKVTHLGNPALYLTAQPAPDGSHILMSKIVRPYSYLVTYERFPQDVEVWKLDRSGAAARIPIASLPLADRVPIHGVPVGPRDFSWRATAPATLVWAEALDGGDWNVQTPMRDKVMLSHAPFNARGEIFRTEQRYAGLDWFEQPDLALLSQYDQNKHWEKTFIVNVDNLEQKPRLLWDHSSDEKYAHPGMPVFKRLASGALVIRQQQNTIFLAGPGASESGDRPFLDRLNLQTLISERLFRSERSAYEDFMAFTGAGEKTFLTWHQTPTEVPNVFVRTLAEPIPPAKGDAKSDAKGEALFASSSVALTHIADPTPQVRQIQKRLVRYKRADGLDLSFTLYTPPGYKEGTRVPTILYAYPLDYADSSKAGQVTGSQKTFTRLRNYRLLLLAGYALIDQASFPIVGDPKNAYDTYMEQLVANAKGAIDEAVRLGVADPKHIGVTGHSHGALMTANLVLHSDLFRAGVATSGSYNKTLTPFGFQNERRTLWEAPEVYRRVSPIFAVDKLKVPLLIMHGADDANPGTTPMQANFLYEAIRNNGGTARLVMLPHEPHWYTARESNEQLIYEMLSWFDRFVK